MRVCVVIQGIGVVLPVCICEGVSVCVGLCVCVSVTLSVNASAKLLKGVLQRTFFLFQLTNDLCTSFTKIVIILFSSKAVFIKRTLLFQYFCAKNRTIINWYYFHFLSSYAFTIINNVIMREENSSCYRT